MDPLGNRYLQRSNVFIWVPFKLTPFRRLKRSESLIARFCPSYWLAFSLLRMKVGRSKSISLRVVPVDKRTTHFVSITEPFVAENTSQVVFLWFHAIFTRILLLM